MSSIQDDLLLKPRLPLRSFYYTKLSFIILLNFILVFFSFAMGPGDFSFSEVLSFIFPSISHRSSHFLLATDPDTFSYVLIHLRIPRTFALVSIGLSLGYCGIILQTLLDNPLSEPYTLGLSGGATLGAVLMLLFGLEPMSLFLPMGSALGCFLVTLFILGFSFMKNLWKSNSMILVGVMISLFCGALVTLLISLLEPHKMQLALFWMMGQVGSTRDAWWPSLLALYLFALYWGFKNHIHLDRILLGDDLAQNLGTRSSALRIHFIVIVCLLTATSVSIAGLVGFVGLVAPHLTYYMLKTRRHSKALLFSSLVGSSLFLISDLLARYLGRDIEIPAGSFMALMGAPLLIYFLFKRFRHIKN